MARRGTASFDQAVVGEGQILDVTLSLDTSAYADGDVLADTQIATALFRANDYEGYITGVTVIDQDDQGQPFDLYFLDANVSMGTENSTPSITDANAANILGKIAIAAGDYYDLGGVRVATVDSKAIKVKPASGTNDGYIAAISRGTGTYTASGVIVRIAIAWD